MHPATMEQAGMRRVMSFGEIPYACLPPKFVCRVIVRATANEG